MGRGKKTLMIVAILAAACALSACAPVQGESVNMKSDVRKANEVKEPEAISYEDYDSKWKLREENPLDETFLAGLESFSFKTSQELLKGRTENINYSPVSLYYAMAMAAAGAGGETKSEITTFLETRETELLTEQCRRLYLRLFCENEYSKVKLANSMWLQNSYPFEKAYLDMAAKDFYASLYQVDFADEKTGKTIGKWIADQTEGKLTPEIKTSDREVLSIINTVYYKSEWMNSFNPSNNMQGDFHRADGGVISCEYMKRTDGMAGFYKGDGFMRASMPLKEGDMIFILPDEDVKIDDLLSSETAMKQMFSRYDGLDMAYGVVNWQVPKFEFKSQMGLNDMVQKLGVQSAFSPDADFSGISKEGAFITKITQQTSIGIDENGVEAAAYTEMALAGAGISQDYAEMVLDRPFLYGITGEEGVLMFIGVCNDPTMEAGVAE